MATLAQRITDLSTRIATEFKSVRSAIAAISSGAAINDAATSGTATWSSTKIANQITSQVNALVGAAPAALDTLAEIDAAIGSDANFAATMTAALGNRVRFDAAQTLTAPQKAQAKANMDAYGSLEIGNPDTDFVAVFAAGLL